MQNLPAYKIYPLGDSALSVDFGNFIRRPVNEIVLSLFNKLQKNIPEGITEVAPAYSSLTIYYDVAALHKKIPGDITVFEWVKNVAEQFLQQENEIHAGEKRKITIPVCYEKEFAPDLDWAALQCKIPVEEIIRVHISKTYHVFMLGFLPGFAYMGEVDDKIKMPRKPQPKQVVSGSVGIAGSQTGIYPLNSPGGWQIIGRTPIKLFDKNREEPILFNAGDSVQFYSITKDEFEIIKSRNS